jgi:hypothetical protein
MESLEKLCLLTKNVTQKLDLISAKIKKLDTNLKICGHSLYFIFVTHSHLMKDGINVRHICIVWENRIGRVMFSIYDTPNEKNSFSDRKLIFSKHLAETDAKIRTELEPFLDIFIEKITTLIEQNIKKTIIDSIDNDLSYCLYDQIKNDDT